MDEKNECLSETRNLNVTLVTEKTDENSVRLSIHTIFKVFKQHWVFWLMFAIILGGLIVGFNVFRYSSNLTPVQTMVEFSYDGIENGQNPNGSDFDASTFVSQKLIADTLDALHMEHDEMEKIRTGINVSPILPENTLEQMTMYENVYDTAQSGNLAAGEAMVKVRTNWFATRYKIEFDFNETSLSRHEATLFLNKLTELYRNYFFKQYGYNEAFGNNLKDLDYTTYDYSEAIDLFSSNLDSLKSYVNNLASDDKTRFKSSATGYSFADLRAKINNIQELNLDYTSSFIAINNITKDEDRTLAYYRYRIENLTRSKQMAAEKLASITESINSYEKDQIIIFGNGTDSTNTQYSQASKEYDSLISQKISTQSDLSYYEQRINYYNDRIVALKSATVGAGSADKKQVADEELADIYNKIMDLIEDVENTAKDYYENISLAGAYSIVAPATNTAAGSVVLGISSSIIPVLAVELILFFLFIAFVTIKAIKVDNAKYDDTDVVAEKKSEKKSKSAKA